MASAVMNPVALSSMPSSTEGGDDQADGVRGEGDERPDDQKDHGTAPHEMDWPNAP
jgi:hypothetical protein